MKLHFLVIGTQKGGTTTLDAYLRQHPQICLPYQQKELHFFDNEKIDWNTPDYSNYHEAFSPTWFTQCIGEITPIYMYWEPSLLRIYRYNPAIKLIMLLRNPILRAYSHWNMEINRGTEHLPFIEALQKESERCQPFHYYHSYVSRSLYAKQIKNLFSIFSEDQLLILKSESFFKNPRKELSKIYHFLGIKKIFPKTGLHTHEGIYKNYLRQEEINFMRDKLKDDLVDLQDLVPWNFKDWLWER